MDINECNEISPLEYMQHLYPVKKNHKLKPQRLPKNERIRLSNPYILNQNKDINILENPQPKKQKLQLVPDDLPLSVCSPIQPPILKLMPHKEEMKKPKQSLL